MQLFAKRMAVASVAGALVLSLTAGTALAQDASGASSTGADQGGLFAGTPASYSTVGAGGNDLLFDEQGGDDFLFDDEGNDRAQAGPGSDRVMLGVGDDRIEGGTGDDELFGEEGDDNLFDGEGDDRLFGGDDDDIASGREEVITR